MREGEVAAWTADRLAQQDAERREYLARHIAATRADPEIKRAAAAHPRPSQPLPRPGDRFGEWIVLACVGRRSTGQHEPLVRCRCSRCGREFTMSVYSLRRTVAPSRQCRPCAAAKATAVLKASSTRAHA